MIKKVAISLLCLALLPAAVWAQSKPQLGKDPVDKILAAMTLDEKVELLVGNYDATAKSKYVADAAGSTKAYPQYNISNIFWVDGATGVRMDTIRQGYDHKFYATGFPVSILLSSTWNADLVQRVGAAKGNELVEFGYDILLAPSQNIQRSPLNGRNFEYYSEDPVLSGKMAAAEVRGIQSQGGGASVKHFAANSQQTLCNINDVRVSQRALREIYLRNFEITIKESDPMSVMSSYNLINGTHVQESKALLRDVLRDEWGYEGVVESDWGLPNNTAQIVKGGTNLLMGGHPSQVKDIKEALKSGVLTEEDIDRNARYILNCVLKTPHFKGFKGSNNPDMKAHAQVAREAAAEGLVLLKNENNTLPLLPTDSVVLFGVGTYYFYANGLGAADVSKPYVVNLMQGLKNAKVNINPVADNFYQQYIRTMNLQLEESNVRNWHNWWFGYKMPRESYIDTCFINRRVKDCSKAIITIARNGGEAFDHDYKEGDYLLTATEKALIEDVSRIFHAKGKPVIVILNTGFAMDVAQWRDKVDAILIAWQPGQEGGNAVADALTGKVNPSGKLPMTLPLDYFDLPSAANFPLHYKPRNFWNDKLRPTPDLFTIKNWGFTNFEEGIWVGYRHFNTRQKAVAYPFGYGLSYTTFAYSDAKLKQKGDVVTVTLKVTNTGKVAGKEAVQLYATAPKGALEKPLRELKAFAKTPLLQPGQTCTLTLTLKVRDLASFDEDQMAWVVDAGQYMLSLAANVEDVRLTVPLQVKQKLVEKVKTKI